MKSQHSGYNLRSRLRVALRKGGVDFEIQVEGLISRIWALIFQNLGREFVGLDFRI